MMRTGFDSKNRQTSCTPSTDQNVAEVLYRSAVGKVVLYFQDGSRFEYVHFDDGSFEMEVGDPVEQTVPGTAHIAGHEIVSVITHDELEEWLDEPQTSVLGLVMVAAVVAVAFTLVVPLAAWLVHVGGWVRALAGASLAVFGLGYVVAIERS